MRTIQTENATYKIADSRNIEDFVKQLKKPKNAAKRFKADKKTFPVFFAGKTSTRQYVEAYYRLNNLNRYQPSVRRKPFWPTCIRIPALILQLKKT
jgi:hypothetical protein